MSRPKRKKVVIGNIDIIDKNLTIVSEEKVQELFKKVNNKDIPWDYVEDGCFARAAAATDIIDQENIEAAKIYVVPTSGPLKVKTDKSDKGSVQWNEYHTAVAVKVKKEDGTIETYVIDPSLFTKAVPVADWYGIQTKQTETYYVFYSNKYHLFAYDRVQNIDEYTSDYKRITKETNDKYLRELETK
jgi:hypothetical protein